MFFLSHILKTSAGSFDAKEAVVCGKKRISYSQLDKLSDKLAAFLISHGIAPGDRIGIFNNKDIEEVISIFAAVKAGAVFVHINPQYKENQLLHLLNDCQIKSLIIDKFKYGIFEKIAAQNRTINQIIKTSDDFDVAPKAGVAVDSMIRILDENYDFEPPVMKKDSSALASIIYTSGSTGMPKGIMVSHQVFEDATVKSAGVLANTENDRIISVTPFSFDGALSQLFTAIYVGGTLVQQKSVFPRDIVRTLLDEKITGFHAMPSLWNILLQHHSPFGKYEYPDLRYVSIIGEHFPPASLLKLKEILKDTRFIMMYGTTEAFRSTYLPYEDFDRKAGSAGIPFPGVEIKIVDDNDQPCPQGATGEIVHSGCFIALGYWNNEADTKRVFKNGSVYTGDLGRLDDEGYLYFVSRKDKMIKSSGFRVSPDEIEKFLYNLDGVKEVAVDAVYDDEKGSLIRAVMVVDEKKKITEKDIINYSRSNLPFYMVPQLIEFRQSLPKTASGKINKSELSKK